MGVKYGNLNVDEKYSAILEPNLYFNSIFADGVSFTSEYEEGPAGGIMVHKLGTSAAEVGTPGRDFVDEATQDELIPIVFNNNYMKSKKLYGVQAAAVGVQLGEANLKQATQEVSEGWSQSGLACLATEGKKATGTAALTKANIKETIIGTRKEAVEKKFAPDVVMCSPATFATIMTAAGSEYTPVLNDYMNQTGQVGKWLGMTFIEANGLAATNASYYDSANAKKTAAFATVDYVMYNHKALSIINNFDVARLIDSERFNGTLAQVELNTAFKVTNPDCVLVRSHAG